MGIGIDFSASAFPSELENTACFLQSGMFLNRLIAELLLELSNGLSYRKKLNGVKNLETDLEWVFCLLCKSKTRIKIRDNTVLKNFPMLI